MIKFRNSGTNVRTQLGILKILVDQFEGKIFGLAEFAAAIAENNLMTAYGYTGETALERSNVGDASRNSANMNVKMYAEVFRILGWLSSYNEDSAYPIIVTELGKYVARSSEPIRLYEQCLLGISSPQEMMDGVHYEEKVRFFLCALKTLDRLGGIMYKHELCMGPMSVNDIDAHEFDAMVSRLNGIRGSYQSYNIAWSEFCDSLNMKPTSVDNQTRFPVGALTACGWVEGVRTNAIYPPRSLQCIKLTDRGVRAAKSVADCKDLRLEEFNSYDHDTQDALIRLGFYQLLGRAGYDLEPIAGILESDQEATLGVTGGKELLFSPFQTLKSSRVNSALGIAHDSYVSADTASEIGSSQAHTANTTVLVSSTASASPDAQDSFESEITDKVKELSESGLSEPDVVRTLFDAERHSNQDRFYPLVSAMFRILGFDCRASRQGDNGSRMDALISGPGDAIPIEIKSPGEEEFISIKAVKQAAENKIIILSRNAETTKRETVSLVVGYHAPNERAEVASLIDAFHNQFGFNIGVIPLDVLLRLVVGRVLHDITVDYAQLRSLRGIAS